MKGCATQLQQCVRYHIDIGVFLRASPGEIQHPGLHDDRSAGRGESVGGGSLNLRADSAPLVLQITRTGEDHLIEIRTRKSVGSERKGRSIAYRLVDPSGATIVEDSEILSHKKRSFSFEPTLAGDYTLYAEETKLVGSGRGTAYVAVTVNDRRVLSRLLGL